MLSRLWEMIAPLFGLLAEGRIISLSLRPGVQSLHYYRDRPTFDLFKDHHNEINLGRDHDSTENHDAGGNESNFREKFAPASMIPP